MDADRFVNLKEGHKLSSREAGYGPGVSSQIGSDSNIFQYKKEEKLTFFF